MAVPEHRGDGLTERDPRISRLERLRDQRGWAYPGPVGGFGATTGAGFDPVGQVFGATVAFLSSAGYGRCFVTAPAQRADRSTADPHNPLLAQIQAGRALALERAVAECRALGGDGVIGMRIGSANFFTQTEEFTVEGTAVQARAQTRSQAPFTTHVSGQELAKLLRSGWMPFRLVSGIAIAAVHFDERMIQQTRRGIGAGGNREVVGYTRLVNDARREARRALENAVRDAGGEGAVVQDISIRFFERACPNFEERSDYVVEATILGSAVIAFERTGSPRARPPLTIMRLGRGVEAVPEPAPATRAGPSLSDRAFAYVNADKIATQPSEPDA
ncbi:heavy metal-binding domain-containing protein [Actinospica sp. MGRD01-02]|uniref:Heavy metal-binding domain-containing protein n=1 Tax=Actinospica acidithermotolerans TaxID=2828514 RepID=A0A941ECA6_9ACTN|nr:heavy metal-binding domain-containing protein [Actinospica acidithermotolerans]MBR7828901.1 heavy metal-binding domain-containing protein [Actinospica acidithermotolerans]